MRRTKIIRHKWNKKIRERGLVEEVCEKCGCIRYWDFDYDRKMYRWGTNITYRAPSCIVSINNQRPYNPIPK